MCRLRLICEAFICRFVQFLVILQICTDAVNDIRNRKVSANAFDIINSVRSEQPLQDACNEIYHDNTALLPEHLSKLAENLHALLIYDKFRRLADRCAFGLYTLPKACGELKNRVFGDVQRDIFVAFFLVAYMNETMVYTHFELRGRLVSAPLVFVELLETL